jgi:mRNA-degrading endonuclease RelE of RelBE toxin-antitoxin system
MMKRLDLWVEPPVHETRRQLPGHMRQQVKRAIASLADDPRPPISRALDVASLDVPPGVEIRRLRLDRWRVVYAMHETEAWVWVLAIHRRPPYDYEDLADLVVLLGEQL